MPDLFPGVRTVPEEQIGNLMEPRETKFVVVATLSAATDGGRGAVIGSVFGPDGKKIIEVKGSVHFYSKNDTHVAHDTITFPVPAACRYMIVKNQTYPSVVVSVTEIDL